MKSLSQSLDGLMAVAGGMQDTPTDRRRNGTLFYCPLNASQAFAAAEATAPAPLAGPTTSFNAPDHLILYNPIN